MPSTLSLVQSKVSSSFFTIPSISSRAASDWLSGGRDSLSAVWVSSSFPGSSRSMVMVGAGVVSGPFPRNRSASGLETTKLTAATTPKMTALKNSRKTRTAVCRLLSGGFTIFSLMNGFSLDLFSSGASAISHKTPLLSIIVFLLGLCNKNISRIFHCFVLYFGKWAKSLPAVLKGPFYEPESIKNLRIS